MSAALLRNNKKCNQLEDDLESSLHVLTWTALRFTEHMCSEGDSSTFLRAFDEEYEDANGVKGEDLKRDFAQLVKYHAWSSLTIDHTWTNSLESSPRHLLCVTRSRRPLSKSTNSNA